MPDDTKRYESETDRLDAYLAQKRAKDAEKRDADVLARAQQVRTLQGMLGQVSSVRCPHCGELIVDPRPTAPDDDYDTRA